MMGNTSKNIRLVTVPVVVAPLSLLFLAPGEYEGAFYTFWPIMLVTLLLNIPLVLIKTRPFKMTLLLGWAGVQAGCILHILAQYGIIYPHNFIDWPLYGDGNTIVTPDWFLLSVLLGLLVGGIIDFWRNRAHQATKENLK